MIISSTPLRMSFVGGGSDIDCFCKEETGAVLATTINRYIYITVNDRFEEGIRLGYSKTEIVKDIEKIEHRVVRVVLRKLGIEGMLEITSMADIPSHGTGLGSSSAFAVGLLNALHAYKREFSSAEDLARESCDIEINVLGDPVGKQDQYIAAYGGFKFIQFNPDGSVYVDPVICLQETLDRLQSNLLVFYTGRGRRAADILKAQHESVQKSPQKKQMLRRMVQLAFDLRNELQRNNLDTFGEMLHENWVLKKEMARAVSNDAVDGWYDKAVKAGAVGGKLLGAGGGGFLVFYAPKERHSDIRVALSELRPVEMSFEKQGSKIIFIH